MAGIADRNEMVNVAKQASATTAEECVRRAADALAYAEECFLIGATKKASGLMALARGYQSLAKLMPTPDEEG